MRLSIDLLHRDKFGIISIDFSLNSNIRFTCIFEK